MVDRENLEWSKYLSNIEENKNNSYNSSIKAIPSQIWKPTKEINEEIAENIKQLTERKMEKFQELDDFQIGDIVRVKMSSIFSNVRKLVKDGNSKQILFNYSPKLFFISHVIIPRKKMD